MVNTTTFTDDSDPYYSELDPNYSTVSMATMNRENIYTEAATATGKGEVTQSLLSKGPMHSLVLFFCDVKNKSWHYLP